MQDDTTTTALAEPEPMPDPESPEDEAGDEVLTMSAEDLHLHELDAIAREMITELGEEAFGDGDEERFLHPLVTVDYPGEVYNTIVVEIYAGGPAAPEEYDSATLIARIADFDPTDTADVERIYEALKPAGLAYLREGTVPDWPVQIYGRRPASGLSGPAEPRQPTLSDEVFGPYHLRVVKISVSGSFTVPLEHLQAWADDSNPLKLGRDAEITLQGVIDEARLSAKGTAVAGALRIKATDLLKLHIQETAYIMAERDREDDEEDGDTFGEDTGLEAAADGLLEEGDVEACPQDETLPLGEEGEDAPTDELE
ncbi:MAG: hypothetical protein ACYC6T_08145 [Thermoleophilia bacterium]